MAVSQHIKIFHHPNEVQNWRKSIEKTGLKVGFVPTMGALHEGHATLLRKLRSRCDVLVLSIFLNPTQFGASEDLSKYPKTFERDLEIAKKEGVDVVFAPTPDQMYPTGFSTYVEELDLTKPLCGKFRPGHFRGVTTVVLKLFNIVRPDLSLFGLKDAQQFFVLDKMLKDLNLNTEIEGIQTVRESDGLALSSRNIYLTQDERKLAPEIYKILKSVAQQISEEKISVKTALGEAKLKLTSLGFDVQYLEYLSLPHLKETKDYTPGQPYLLAIAAYVGKTRLIDNVILGAEQLKTLGISVENY